MRDIQLIKMLEISESEETTDEWFFVTKRQDERPLRVVSSVRNEARREFL
jgi:hypothetical protein